MIVDTTTPIKFTIALILLGPFALLGFIFWIALAMIAGCCLLVILGLLKIFN